MADVLHHSLMQETVGVVNAMRFAVTPDAHNSATLAAALAALGSTPTTLVLEPATWTLTSTVVIPATCVLKIPRGTLLNLGSGVTLTLGSAVCSDDPTQQLFTGAGVVVFAMGTGVPIFPQWWGAVGDGVADDTAAVQAALTCAAFSTFDAQVSLPAGRYLTTAQLSVGTYTRVMGEGNATVLVKALNGYLLDLQSFASLEHFKIDGQGATYTGAGVLISTGTVADNTGHQLLSSMTIWETEASNVEYSTAGAGYGSTIVNCDLRVYNDQAPSIKLPDDGAVTGNRHIVNCRNAGGDLIDVGQCQNTTILGCFSGANASNGSIIFSGINPKKCIIVGNRFANGDTLMTVNGNDHVFAGNVIAGPVYFSNLCNNVRFDSTNVIVGALQIDDTTKSCFVDNTVRRWTPNWYGATTNPTLGDGVLGGRYSTINRRRFVDIALLIGSTTVLPTGIWSFGAPGEASADDATDFAGNPVTYVGSAFMTHAGFALYAGVCYVQPGSQTIYVVANGFGNVVTETIPFTWAAGDSLYLSMNYDI